MTDKMMKWKTVYIRLHQSVFQTYEHICNTYWMSLLNL